VTRLLLLILFLAGCASAPQSPIKSGWTPDDNWWSAASIRGGTLKVKDGSTRSVSAANAKNLYEVQKEIQKQSFLTTRLALVETDSPNAFATTIAGQPTIAVSLDFLDALGSDRDALATTLGHEIAHLYYRHGAIRQERNEAAKGASQVLGTILGLAGVPLGGTIANVGVTAVTTSFSRDEEREADTKGLQWATAAGFSACGSARTIAMLQSKSSGGGIPFLSTHPGYEERIARAGEASMRLTGKGC